MVYEVILQGSFPSEEVGCDTLEELADILKNHYDNNKDDPYIDVEVWEGDNNLTESQMVNEIIADIIDPDGLERDI
jgi:hypothetical protein